MHEPAPVSEASVTVYRYVQVVVFYGSELAFKLTKAILSRLFCTSYPVPAVIFLAVLSLLSCSAQSSLSCPGYAV